MTAARQVRCTAEPESGTPSRIVRPRGAEPDRRPSLAGFRAAYLAAGVAMARLTPDGVIVDANRRFAELVGRPVRDLAGTRFLSLLHDEETEPSRFANFTGGKLELEVRLKTAGAAVCVKATVSIARRPRRPTDDLVVTLEEIRQAREQPSAAAVVPAPPGLPGRLHDSIREAGAASAPLSFFLFEVGGLAAIESEHGSEIAEKLLERLGERLAGQLPCPESFVRSGREFAVILPQVDLDQHVDVRGRLQKELESAVRDAGVSLSIFAGSAAFPHHGPDPETLIRRARYEIFESDVSAAAWEPAEDLAAVEERITFLEPVPFFASVPAQVLRRIARYMSAQTATSGEEIDGPSAPPALRIIQEGHCEVFGPSESRLMTLGPGDYMGLGQLLLDDAVEVRIRALTDCRLLVLDPETLDRAAPAGTPLRETLRQAAQQRNQQVRALWERPQRPGFGHEPLATSIAVYSPNGGSGKTTLALNLAAELAARNRNSVLLIDLALPYNHVALLSGLSPATCLARTSAAPRFWLEGQGWSESQGFGQLLWSAVLPHPAGFMVLPGALRPEEADMIDVELVTRAVSVLAPHFDYLVFDLGVTLDDRVLAALDIADDLVLVAAPELASMHDTRLVRELVTGVLNLPEGRIHLVLNHRSSESAMRRADVELVLGAQLTAEVPYQGAQLERDILRCRLQTKDRRRGQFAALVRQLADRVENGAPVKVASA